MNIQNVNPSAYKEPLRYPHPNLHRVLLVASAGLSIASVIPASRQIASLMLRSIAFISSTAICTDSWEKEDTYNRILNISRIGIVALGIVGVAAARPVILVTSLAAEVGLQAITVSKALYEGDYERTLTHLVILVIDSLVLGAIAAGSTQLMLAAAMVNLLAMISLCAIKFRHKDLITAGDIIDTACYYAFAGASIVSFIDIYGDIYNRLDSASFNIKNDKESVMKVFDSDHKHIATLNPGESTSFVHQYTGSHPKADLTLITYDSNGFPNQSFVHPDHKNFVMGIIPPLKKELYPTIPIGGTMIVDRIQT